MTQRERKMTSCTEPEYTCSLFVACTCCSTMKDGTSCMNTIRASCLRRKDCVEEIQEMTGAKLMSVSRGNCNLSSIEKPKVMETKCPAFARCTAFCSTFQYPVCSRPIVDSQISPTRFQISHAEFGYMTPFDLTLDLWRSAFTSSIDSARSQPILLLLQLLRLLKAFQRSWSGYCCC